ncbi:hypothetical protein [Aquimonas voraii]|uniref:DUF4440 domain-containing protein n=1 Tax=Aquimonas voraii TaxID=265719 RepID=A0A1G6STW6_9GAMM|nr:hypothetical protein [Aquimonas voraii]SDD19716.1 hypothetical protein SAMN04488509_101665 [Aquimonas voraii]
MQKVRKNHMAVAGKALRRRVSVMPVRWLLAVLFLPLLVAACSRAPAEQRLHEAMAGLQSAIEAREVRVAMGYVDEDFIGSGSLDREGARNLLRAMVLRHQSLGLTLGPAEIELFEGRAAVRFTAVATGGQGALLPQSARVWQVETAWRDHGSDWRLISAHWD